MKGFIFVVSSVLLSAPSAAFAAGWSTADQSVIAMSTGGAGTARASDPAAAWYNPGAAIFSEGLDVSVGSVFAAPLLSARGADWSASTGGGLSAPPHLHVGWSNDQVGGGLSVAVPFASSIRWPQTWQRRFDLVEADLTTVRISAFAGARFGRFSFGLGPFVDLGSLQLARQLDFIEVEGQTNIDTAATGFGVHAGLFYRALEQLDFGLTYRSRSKLSLTGFADFSTPLELAGRTPDQAVAIDITLPDRLAVGAQWRPIDRLSIDFDLELYLWNTVEALVIDFDVEETPDQNQARSWSATLSPRVGASVRLLEWLTARGGFFVDPSPTPANTAGASSPDSTRLGVTLGAGLEAPESFGLGVAIALDVAFTHVEMLGVDATFADGSAAAFSGRVEMFGVSARLAL